MRKWIFTGWWTWSYPRRFCKLLFTRIWVKGYSLKYGQAFPSGKQQGQGSCFSIERIKMSGFSGSIHHWIPLHDLKAVTAPQHPFLPINCLWLIHPGDFLNLVSFVSFLTLVSFMSCLCLASFLPKGLFQFRGNWYTAWIATKILNCQQRCFLLKY